MFPKTLAGGKSACTKVQAECFALSSIHVTHFSLYLAFDDVGD